MGCVDEDAETDITADMTWMISRTSGAIQLSPLLPLEVVYQSAHGSGCVGALWREHHTQFAQFIKKFLPKTVLEIGGGHGHLSRIYQQTNTANEWIIVEPNPTPAEGVTAKYIDGFFDSNFSIDSKVDAIVHSHVFEHIYEPLVFLSDISSFLKTGNHLLFSVPNMQEMIKRKYSNCVNFEHTILLTEEYIEYMLADQGFHVVEKKYFQEDHSIFYAAEKKTDVAKLKLSEELYMKYKTLFLNYVSFHENLVKEINAQIAALEHGSSVFLFGAHIFSQYLLSFGINSSRIVALLDNDKQKTGKRLYGTNLQVLLPEILRHEHRPTVILRAGAYDNEIKKDILENINPNTLFIS
jgi:predicted SAM-dependent methyltransferase